jgi:hypothetical protein
MIILPKNALLSFQLSLTLDRVIQDFGLYRISVYSGFGLDRFHCSMILPSKPLFGEVFINETEKKTKKNMILMVSVA